MSEVKVVIVGAGQAGLAVSHELTQAGVEHLVLEKGRVGETWRGRWDSFCLVTPNWSVLLPGGHYAGEDPDGFMSRDEFVEYLERCAAGFQAPVREGVAVISLATEPDGASCSRPRTARWRRRPSSSRRARSSVRTGWLRRLASERPPPARRRGLSQPWRAPGRASARRRERPVGVPDLGGTARGRPPGLPLLRPDELVAALHRRPRPRLVVPGDRFPRRPGRRVAEPGGPAV